MTPGVVATRHGSSIYIEDTGSGRLPVLALHGLGGGAYFFRGLAARLDPRYRILAIDMPGTGRSTSGPAPWSLESWVDDVGDLVADRIGAPAVLVGHSLGTIVALQVLAARAPHIRGLVFVGGLPRVRPIIRERLTERVAHVTRRGMIGLGPQVTPGIFSSGTFQRHAEVIALFERVFEAQPQDAYLRGIEVLLGASAEAVLAGARVPCLAITGEDDQYAPPDAVHAFVSALPVACREEVIPGCGHMPFFEAPDAFASLVESFLDTL